MSAIDVLTVDGAVKTPQPREQAQSQTLLGEKDTPHYSEHCSSGGHVSASECREVRVTLLQVLFQAAEHPFP